MPTRNTLNLFIVVLLLNLLVATIAIVVGGTLPLPSTALPLANSPCNLPCIFGIIPGQTMRDEAFATLEAMTVPESAQQNVFRMPAASATDAFLVPYIVEVQYNADHVSTLRLITNGDNLFATLGDVLRLGGRPMRMFRTCNGMFPARLMLVFGEHQQTVVEMFLSGDFDAWTPVILLDAAELGIRSVYDARTSFGCSVEIQWRGFAPSWRYQQDTGMAA